MDCKCVGVARCPGLAWNVLFWSYPGWVLDPTRRYKYLNNWLKFDHSVIMNELKLIFCLHCYPWQPAVRALPSLCTSPCRPCVHMHDVWFLAKTKSGKPGCTLTSCGVSCLTTVLTLYLRWKCRSWRVPGFDFHHSVTMRITASSQ